MEYVEVDSDDSVVHTPEEETEKEKEGKMDKEEEEEEKMDKEEDDEMEYDNIKEENEEGNGGSNWNDSKSRPELLDALVDHGDDSQVNEKEAYKPAVKYGPPTGKWKEGKKASRPLTSQFQSGPAMQADSLMLADTDRPSDQPTTSNSKKTTSKKQTLEEEDHKADAPGKCTKVDNGLPLRVQKKGKDPVSTPEPPVRVRGAGRIKEFPAGNTVTSGSRITFLNSLCSLPTFRALVDLVQAVVRMFFI